MELIQQARRRLTEEALTDIFPYMKSEMEPKSTDREEDDGEGSYCSQSLSYSEYGLNPHAQEFVPSHLKKRVLPIELKDLKRESDTKSEATSTTSLFPLESLTNEEDDVAAVAAAEAADKETDDTLDIQRQIFEFLSQMGDEKLSLDSIKITLLPEGHGINIQFTTGQDPFGPGTSVSTEYIGKKSFKEILCHQTALHLDITDQEKLANKPENVLVAQFLQRASDLLSEKFDWNAPPSSSTRPPKCLVCANRSYTEMEIEQQIDGIKSFEKFLSLTESMGLPRLGSQKEFKELCCQLGLNLSNDQVNCEQSLILPSEPPILADDNASEEPKTKPKYVCGKIYRFDDNNGQSTLINQLEGDGDGDLHRSVEGKLMIYNDGDQNCLDAPPSTPAMSTTKTNLLSSKSHKLSKAKASSRSQAYSGNPPPRRTAKLQNDKTNLNVQKMREANKTPNGGKTAKKTQLGALFASAKKANGISHVPLERSTGRQSIASSSTGRQGSARSGTSGGLNSKPIPSSSTSYSSKVVKGNSAKSTVVGRNLNQKIVPRSTTASLMRQSAVKRRLSLLRGESDSDLPFNEYLFK